MKKSILGFAAIIVFAAVFMSSCKDDENEKEIALTLSSVKMSHAKIDVPVGDGICDSTFVLTYDLVPAKAKNIESITWSSSNTGIASVSVSGLITSVSLGTSTVTVTVKTTDGKTFTDKCDVTVVPSPIAVESIEFESDGHELIPNGKVTLKPVILPENASNKSLNWESNNYNVVDIDDNGVATAEALGKAIITATTVDGQLKARINVTVVGVAVSNLTLQAPGKSLEVDEEVQLVATLLPTDATNQKLVWTSEDPLIATVDTLGNVKAVMIGTTNITVATIASGHKASCEIEVVPTDLKGISLEDNADEVKVFDDINKDRTLVVTYIPSNATNKNITSWTSNNTAVADVDQNGKVTFKSSGMVSISATAEEGGYSSSLDIDVDYNARINQAKWSIVGYNDSWNGTNTAGPGWSSQATNEGGVDSPTGRVTAMLSDDVNIFWHSSYSSPALDYPHWFIVDLGEEIDVDAVMLQRRQGNGGTAKGYNVKTSTKTNPDIDDPMGGYDWVDRGDYSFDPGNNARQAQGLNDANVKARYIMMYFDTNHKGSSNFTMFATFGLYKKQ